MYEKGAIVLKGEDYKKKRKIDKILFLEIVEYIICMYISPS